MVATKSPKATAKKPEEKPLIPQDVFEAEINKAVLFATECHSGQFRKRSGLPYITHCFEVLALVSEWGIKDLDVWRACLCHDVMEEKPEITVPKLEVVIGRDAAKICDELTFRVDPASNLDAPRQKAEYMKTFFGKSIIALVAKCADRIRNTLNFLTDDPPYAPKYWRKGNPLFEAMITRSLEIETKFGIGVLARMKFSRDSVSRQVVR